MSPKGEEVVLTAEIRFRAPKAVYVVVSFGDCSDGPRVKTALPFDGSPYDYDLEANECFLVYRLDESALPLTRLLEGDTGNPSTAEPPGQTPVEGREGR